MNNVYCAAASDSESIVDASRGIIYPYTAFTEGDIAESANDPDRLYNYFKFGISLYEQNLVVLDFSYMSENSHRLSLKNLYAFVTGDGDSSIDTAGPAGTDRHGQNVQTVLPGRRLRRKRYRFFKSQNLCSGSRT